MKKNEVQEISESEFETQVLSSMQPVLVGFLTDWSKPCQVCESVLEEVAAACEGRAKVFKINVDDNPDLGNVYRIQSIPTLIYFFNGSVRMKIIGMASAKAILAKLHSLTQGNSSTKDSDRPQ